MQEGVKNEGKKSIFAGTKNVKKSDCTQKFHDSLATSPSTPLKSNLNDNAVKPTPLLKENNHKRRISLQSTPNTASTKKDPLSLQCFARVPLEFALYQNARFQSNEDLLWCTESEESVVSRGICDFLSHGRSGMEIEKLEIDLENGTTNRLEKERLCIAFDRALYYYTYPDAPMEKFYVDAVRERSADNDKTAKPIDADLQRSWSNKRAAWKNSFTSLFRLYAEKFCPLFYCEFPRFTLLFKGPGVAGLSDYAVVMSTSSLRIRDSMDKLGIKYAMPMGKKRSVQSTSNDEEMLKTMSEAEAKLPGQVISVKEEYASDYQVESMLIIEGLDMIRFFANFVTSFYLEQSEIFLPTLLARQAFLHSTLSKLECNATRILTNEMTTAFAVKLTGPVFPDVVATLCSLFEETQSSFFAILGGNTTSQFGKSLKHLLHGKEIFHLEVELKNEMTILEKDSTVTEMKKDSERDKLLYFCPIISTPLLGLRLDWSKGEDGAGKYLLNQKIEG